MPFNPIEIVGGIALGTGVGGAVADVVNPQLQDLKNTQWALHPDRPLDVASLARLIAESIPVSGFDVGQDATFAGVKDARFKAAIELARQYPGLPEALIMWRRGFANYGNVSGWLHRAGLSDEIVAQMIGPGPDPARLFYERLDPAVVAVAIQRGLMPNDGILPVGPPTATGKVPPMPQVALDPFTEVRAAGVDPDRLKVLARIVGLPASPDLAARMTFRGIIDPVDFDRAIAEGNTRNEWAPFLFDGFREILTANQYAELQLRGFLTADERRLKTDQHGMSHEDSNLLFDVLGRSINAHQIVTGEARGGVYKPPPDTLAEQEAGIPPAFLASLQRGNLRPEYYDLAYHNRYNYPSAFVMRALLQAGVFTADEGYQIFLEMGWKPDLARKVADHYGQATVAASDAHVVKAQTQLWGTTHRSYVATESDDAAATAALQAAGVSAAAVPEILTLWQHERELIRKQLTPAQLKKAYEKLAINTATGAAWTHDETIAALVARGYTVSEAQNYLNIPAGR